MPANGPANGPVNPSLQNNNFLNDFQRQTGIDLRNLPDPTTKKGCEDLRDMFSSHIQHSGELQEELPAIRDIRGVIDSNAALKEMNNAITSGPEVYTTWRGVYNKLISIASQNYLSKTFNQLQNNRFIRSANDSYSQFQVDDNSPLNFNNRGNFTFHNGHRDMIGSHSNPDFINQFIENNEFNRNFINQDINNMDAMVREQLLFRYMQLMSRYNAETEGYTADNTFINLFNTVRGRIVNTEQFFNESITTNDIFQSLATMENLLDCIRLSISFDRALLPDHINEPVRYDIVNPNYEFQSPFQSNNVLSSDYYYNCFNLPQVFSVLPAQDQRRIIINDLDYLRHIDRDLYNNILRVVFNSGNMFRASNANLNDIVPHHRVELMNAYIHIFRLLNGHRNYVYIMQNQNNHIFDILRSDSNYMGDENIVSYTLGLTSNNQRIFADYIFNTCNQLISTSNDINVHKRFMEIKYKHDLAKYVDAKPELKNELVNNRNMLTGRDISRLLSECYYPLLRSPANFNSSYLNLDYSHLTNNDMYDLIIKTLPLAKRGSASSMAQSWYNWFTPTFIPNTWDTPQLLSLFTYWNKNLNEKDKTTVFTTMLELIRSEMRSRYVLDYIEHNSNTLLNKEIILNYSEVYYNALYDLGAVILNYLKSSGDKSKISVQFKLFFDNFGFCDIRSNVECLVDIHNYIVKNKDNINREYILNKMKNAIKRLGFESEDIFDHMRPNRDLDYDYLVDDRNNPNYKYFKVFKLVKSNKFHDIEVLHPDLYDQLFHAKNIYMIKKLFNKELDHIMALQEAKKFYRVDQPLYNNEIVIPRDNYIDPDDENENYRFGNILLNDNIINTNSHSNNDINNIRIINRNSNNIGDNIIRQYEYEIDNVTYVSNIEIPRTDLLLSIHKKVVGEVNKDRRFFIFKNPPKRVELTITSPHQMIEGQDKIIFSLKIETKQGTLFKKNGSDLSLTYLVNTIDGTFSIKNEKNKTEENNLINIPKSFKIHKKWDQNQRPNFIEINTNSNNIIDENEENSGDNEDNIVKKFIRRIGEVTYHHVIYKEDNGHEINNEADEDEKYEMIGMWHMEDIHNRVKKKFGNDINQAKVQITARFVTGGMGAVTRDYEIKVMDKVSGIDKNYASFKLRYKVDIHSKEFKFIKEINADLIDENEKNDGEDNKNEINTNSNKINTENNEGDIDYADLNIIDENNNEGNRINDNYTYRIEGVHYVCDEKMRLGILGDIHNRLMKKLSDKWKYHALIRIMGQQVGVGFIVLQRDYTIYFPTSQGYDTFTLRYEINEVLHKFKFIGEIKKNNDNLNNEINGTDMDEINGTDMDESNYISTDPFSFSFDNMHYHSNTAIDAREFHDDTRRFHMSIHENVKAYLQKHGKNINSKNPPNKFNIMIKITPHERGDNQTWELFVTYAPNEYSPMNTIRLEYIIKDTLFGKMFEKCVYNGLNEEK